MSLPDNTADEQIALDAAAAVARGDVIEDDTSAADKAAADKAAADQAAADAAAAAEAAAKGDKTADELANEEDAAETAEEKAEREAEEAESANKRRVRIPLARHEEILAKARQREEALTARLTALEQAKTPPAERKDVLGEMKTQIDTLQDKYEELVFDGKKDEAKAVRTQLETLRERYTDTKTAAVGNLARQQTIDQLKYDATLAKAEADFPALNPDNEDAFEPAKAQEVASLLEMFANNGLTRQAALEKAIKYVMGAPAAKATTTDNAAETLRAKREKEAREAALKVQKQQPPDGSVTGKDNDKAGNREQAVNILKLSQEQFAKYTEDELSKMRGDTM